MLCYTLYQCTNSILSFRLVLSPRVKLPPIQLYHPVRLITSINSPLFFFLSRMSMISAEIRRSINVTLHHCVLNDTILRIVLPRLSLVILRFQVWRGPSDVRNDELREVSMRRRSVASFRGPVRKLHRDTRRQRESAPWIRRGACSSVTRFAELRSQVGQNEHTQGDSLEITFKSRVWWKIVRCESCVVLREVKYDVLIFFPRVVGFRNFQGYFCFSFNLKILNFY